MSADNGIYIAKFPEGYRVTYAQAIDNIMYYPENTRERKETLKEYFGASKLWNTEDEAWKEARRLYEEDNYVEYGISYSGEFESFEEGEKKEEMNYMQVLPFEEKKTKRNL